MPVGQARHKPFELLAALLPTPLAQILTLDDQRVVNFGNLV